MQRTLRCNLRLVSRHRVHKFTERLGRKPESVIFVLDGVTPQQTLRSRVYRMETSMMFFSVLLFDVLLHSLAVSGL